jgi:hypothetical protein
MPRTPLFFALLLLLVPACLTPPVLPPRPDAGRDARVDAREPPFSVVSLVVRDPDGRSWPEDAAPRTPSFVLTFSGPVLSPEACVLLTGALDDDLLDDLSASPLRAATSARIVDVRANAMGASVTLTPEEQLAPDSTWTIAVPAWLARSDGSRLGAPFAREIVVSADPSAGARATDAWPPDGAYEVPIALPMAAIRFDGDVDAIERAIVLFDREGRPLAGVSTRTACVDVGWPTGACATIRPSAALQPLTAYSLGVRAGALDATGAPLPVTSFRFQTGDGSASAPLEPIASECPMGQTDVGGACASGDDESISLFLALTGAARVAWVAGAATGTSVAARGEVVISLSDLLPSTATTLSVRATDYLETATELSFLVTTTERLPTLSITEVRADPCGVEPRQEYVEIENYGPAPASLANLFLSDSESDGDALPPTTVPAGARVLIVADDFETDDRAIGDDVPVPPATILVRVDHSLGSGGLSNSGEPLFLRDAMHRRISAAPATPAPREGVCMVRAASSMRTGEPGTFEYDPRGTCTPGR